VPADCLLRDVSEPADVERPVDFGFDKSERAVREPAEAHRLDGLLLPTSALSFRGRGVFFSRDCCDLEVFSLKLSGGDWSSGAFGGGSEADLFMPEVAVSPVLFDDLLFPLRSNLPAWSSNCSPK